tara:strand:+ start:50 stop:1102 length:1053 start_codon:yes stop_codon:yes gene_type:complete
MWENLIFALYKVANFFLMYTYQSLIKELSSGKVKSIYFLMGDEPYFIDQVSEFFENQVIPLNLREFDQTIIYGKDTTIENIVNQARRYPMIHKRQLIIVKEAQVLSRSVEKLSDYIDGYMSSTILVFCYKNKTLDKRKALYKKLIKDHVVFESKKIYESNMSSWIKSYLKIHKKKITEKACQLLIDYLGNDLHKVVNELKKLNLINESDVITDEIIETNIGISKDFNNYELNRAISAMDKGKAYQIIDYFTKNPKNHPVVLTIASLYNFFSKLMIYHSCKNQDLNTIAKTVGINPYFVNEYKVASSNFSENDIITIFASLRIIDLKSKGVDSNISTRDLYSELLIRIFKL